MTSTTFPMSVTNVACGRRGRSSGFESRQRVGRRFSYAGASIEKLTCMYPLAWGVSDILRGSSDAALCADLAPLADSHLDGCDLLRCRIIDDRARQVLTKPSATHRLSFSSGRCACPSRCS